MAKFETCTLQITGRTGSIIFSKMTKGNQRWIADALMDMFTVDDAYYDDTSDTVKVQNWHTSIDIEMLRQNLNTLFEENEFNVRLA